MITNHYFTPDSFASKPGDYCCAGIGGGELCGKRRNEHIGPVGGSHTIRVTIDPRGIDVTFECWTGVNGPCHWTCAHDCEIWDPDCMNEHPRRQLDYCNPLEFLTNDDAYWYENYVGPANVEVHSGAIDLIWQNDWQSYGWKYVDEQSTV